MESVRQRCQRHFVCLHVWITWREPDELFNQTNKNDKNNNKNKKQKLENELLHLQLTPFNFITHVSVSGRNISF